MEDLSGSIDSEDTPLVQDADSRRPEKDMPYQAFRNRKPTKQHKLDRGVALTNAEYGVELDFPKEPTYFVIEFSRDAKRDVISAIIEKLRGSQIKGCAELLVSREPTNEFEGLVLHVSATEERLFDLAAETRLMKPTTDGVMRPYSGSLKSLFIIDKLRPAAQILTPADRQALIEFAFEGVRIDRREIGNFSDSGYHGQSVLEWALDEGVIQEIYALHDELKLGKLVNSTKIMEDNDAVEKIRQYFGEGVAMYFSFAKFYTYALTVPAILGIIQFMLPISFLPVYCLFYVVWMSVLLEKWKRKCSCLAYDWGTINMTKLDTPRMGYHGDIRRDPITGKNTPYYATWKTKLFMYVVTLPVVLLCVAIVIYITLFEINFVDEMRAQYGAESYWLYLPAIVHSLFIVTFSMAYEKLATFLTEKENHRTQSQHDAHKVIKLVIVEFFNNFFSFFYIAFWLQDIEQLRSELFIQIAIVQVFQNIPNMVFTICYQKFPSWFRVFSASKQSESSKRQKQMEYSGLGVAELPTDDWRVKSRKTNSTLTEYDSTYEDFLELCMQFGYIILFAPVAPYAPFYCLIFNIVDIKVDFRVKLGKIYRRPFIRRVKDIGSWLLAFRALSIFSIIANCGMLYSITDLRWFAPHWSEVEWVIAFVALEHFLLFVVWFIDRAIPDKPARIAIAMAKTDYTSQKALIHEPAPHNA